MKRAAALLFLVAGCSGVQDRAALKEEIKQELLAELQAVPTDEARSSEVPSGSVEGRLVFRGEGVSGCRVKLVRILESTTFLGLFREAKRGVEFESRTDPAGRYHLEHIPPGSYRFLWQVPGDTGWLRRLREEPDAVVRDGEVVSIPDVKLGRRPLGSVKQ